MENELIKEEEKLEIKPVIKKEKPVYITIEDFLHGYPNLNKAQKFHYIGNHKTNDLRVASDWIGLTGLK